MLLVLFRVQIEFDIVLIYLGKMGYFNTFFSRMHFPSQM